MPITHRRRRAFVALTAAALTLAGASSAHAFGNQALAVQPDGTAHFAWVSDANKIGTRAWPATADPLAAQILSLGGSDLPEVAANAAGQVAYVWHRAPVGSSLSPRLEARRRAADGSFGPVVPLTTAGYPGTNPDAAISANGSAFFVWERDTYIVGRRVSADGTVGPTRFISGAGHATYDPDVAMDAAGNAFVVWSRRDAETNQETVHVRRVSATDSLGVAKTLSFESFSIEDPQVGVDGAGDAVIAWLQYEGSGHVPKLRVRKAVGTYSGIEDLGAGGTSAADLDLAVNPAGDATAVWQRDNDINRTIELRRRAADGTLGLLRTMSALGDTIAERPQVAMDAEGGAYVAWEQHPGSEPDAMYVIKGRRRTPAGTLTAIQQLSDPADRSHYVRVGVDDDGNATIGWEVIVPGQPTLNTIEARRRLIGAGNLTPIKTIAE